MVIFGWLVGWFSVAWKVIMIPQSSFIVHTCLITSEANYLILRKLGLKICD